jgi:hypothetical protein
LRERQVEKVASGGNDLAPVFIHFPSIVSKRGFPKKKNTFEERKNFLEVKKSF